MEWTNEMTIMMIDGVRETLFMTLLSTIFGYLLGLPMGVALAVTDKNGIRPNAVVYKILDIVANVVRSIPFLILLILIMPLTKLLVGRSYGTAATVVPLTVAAALIMLTPWRKDRILVDPFCGSGTIPIEAAMMAAHMAPGIDRSFTAEDWGHIADRKCWYRAADEAESLIDLDVETDIQGYDIDDEMVAIARANARLAGVEQMIHFQRRGVEQLSHPKKYGFIITNPPYGERLEDKENLPRLYGTIGERYRMLDSWSMYLITSYEKAEQAIGRRADKNRKIYNGMMKTYFYQFVGPKPTGSGRRERNGYNNAE